MLIDTETYPLLSKISRTITINKEDNKQLKPSSIFETGSILEVCRDLILDISLIYAPLTYYLTK